MRAFPVSPAYVCLATVVLVGSFSTAANSDVQTMQETYTAWAELSPYRSTSPLDPARLQLPTQPPAIQRKLFLMNFNMPLFSGPRAIFPAFDRPVAELPLRFLSILILHSNIGV